MLNWCGYLWLYVEAPNGISPQKKIPQVSKRLGQPSGVQIYEPPNSCPHPPLFPKEQRNVVHHLMACWTHFRIQWASSHLAASWVVTAWLVSLNWQLYLALVSTWVGGCHGNPGPLRSGRQQQTLCFGIYRDLHSLWMPGLPHTKMLWKLKATNKPEILRD